MQHFITNTGVHSDLCFMDPVEITRLKSEDIILDLGGWGGEGKSRERKEHPPIYVCVIYV